jgi:hypothetical protein
VRREKTEEQHRLLWRKWQALNRKFLALEREYTSAYPGPA